MERWKEYQIEQITRAKEIENAFPILSTFARNLGFQFCGIKVSRPGFPSFNASISITSQRRGTTNTKKLTQRTTR